MRKLEQAKKEVLIALTTVTDGHTHVAVSLNEREREIFRLRNLTSFQPVFHMAALRNLKFGNTNDSIWLVANWINIFY